MTMTTDYSYSTVMQGVDVLSPEGQSLVKVYNAVEKAKEILLANRVKNFTASDVVSVAALIMQTESQFASRG